MTGAGDTERWERYLYERHSRAALATWAPTLRYFRYCRAAGGHANDSDQLLVALLDRLGIPVVTLPPDEPRPVPGQAYTAAGYAAFRQPVAEHPDVAQPGWLTLGGVRAHAWVGRGRLDLALFDETDPYYDVTDRTIAGARRIEPLLEPVADLVIDPPRDTRNCVCPKYHPNLWPDARGPGPNS
ncbi:hypothetical protein [Longispora urticae]